MWLLLISRPILDIILQMIFLMTMISIDNVEHYLFKGILYCESLIFVQGNIILRKFNMCSLGVKLTLFRTYCSPMYTAQLWWNYKKSTITKLQIAYHNI